LKVSVREDKAWKRTLEIEIPAERVDSEFEKVFKEYRSKVRIRGFRPGKAPMEMIKKRFKEAAAKEVLESLVPEAYGDALKERSLTPVTGPQIVDIEIEPGSPLRFKAEIEIRPEIEVKDYRGIAVTRKEIKVTDEDIDKNLKMLQEKSAVLKPTDREANEPRSECFAKNQKSRKPGHFSGFKKAFN
jgi:trigger factor